MVLPDDGQRQAAPGASFILQWFEGIFAGDDYARSATRRVLMEVCTGRARPCGHDACGCQGWGG